MDESASDANTGRAMLFGKRVCPSSPEDIGRPTISRFSAVAVLDIRYSGPIAGGRLRPVRSITAGIMAARVARTWVGTTRRGVPRGTPLSCLRPLVRLYVGRHRLHGGGLAAAD